MAICAADDCEEELPPRTGNGRARHFCSDACRVRNFRHTRRATRVRANATRLVDFLLANREARPEGFRGEEICDALGFSRAELRFAVAEAKDNWQEPHIQPLVCDPGTHHYRLPGVPVDAYPALAREGSYIATRQGRAAKTVRAGHEKWPQDKVLTAAADLIEHTGATVNRVAALLRELGEVDA